MYIYTHPDINKRLKRCPICKGKAEVRENTLYYSNGFRIRCTSCSLSTHHFLTDIRTPDEAVNLAIQKWNKRRILPWPKHVKQKDTKNA